MERRVVAELGPGQPVEPVAWAVAGEAPQVHGDGLVHRLRLAIRLRMEGRAETQLDARLTEEVPPHPTSENRVAVADDGLRKSVEPNNVVEEGAGVGRGGVRLPQRDEVRVLGEPVHDGEDDALAVHLGQGLDEVDGNIRPNSGGDRQGL